MTGSAAAQTGPPVRSLGHRALRGLAWLALPLCVSSPGGTVALAILALAGLVFLSRGARPDAAARDVFRLAATLYLWLLAIDLLNGAPVETLISTGVNYLPLIAVLPVHIALRQVGIGAAETRRGARAAVLVAGLLALPSVATLVTGGAFVPATGIFLNQIPFGLVVAVLGTFCLSTGINAQDRGAGLDVLAAGIAVAVVLMTESKLVWGCLLVAYGAVLVLSRAALGRRGALVWGLGSAAVILAALSLAPVRAEIAHFVTIVAGILESGELPNESIGFRLRVYDTAFAAFMEKPVLGWGNFNQMSTLRAMSPEIAALPPRVSHLHNDYLVHLFGFGLGGAVFLAGFFWLIVRVARCAAIPERRALLASIPAIALYMGFDIFFNMDALTGLIGLVLAIALGSGQSGPDHRNN